MNEIKAGQTWKNSKGAVLIDRVDATDHGTYVYTSTGVAYGKKAFLDAYTLVE